MPRYGLLSLSSGSSIGNAKQSLWNIVIGACKVEDKVFVSRLLSHPATLDLRNILYR